MTSFLWIQNSVDQAVSQNKCFIIYRATEKNCRMLQHCKSSQTESACIVTSKCIKVTTFMSLLCNMRLMSHGKVLT